MSALTCNCRHSTPPPRKMSARSRCVPTLFRPQRRARHIGQHADDVRLQRPEKIQERLGLRAGGFDSGRINCREQLERDPAFGIRLRACRGRSSKRLDHSRFGDVFQPRPLLECALPELRSEIPSQRDDIGQKPGFHSLDHQKRLIVSDRANRSVPMISAIERLFASAPSHYLGPGSDTGRCEETIPCFSESDALFPTVTAALNV